MNLQFFYPTWTVLHVSVSNDAFHLYMESIQHGSRCPETKIHFGNQLERKHHYRVFS